MKYQKNNNDGVFDLTWKKVVVICYLGRYIE